MIDATTVAVGFSVRQTLDFDPPTCIREPSSRPRARSAFRPVCQGSDPREAGPSRSMEHGAPDGTSSDEE
ncbi:hypothetical protein GCM10022282_07720 [Agromyces indicus]